MIDSFSILLSHALVFIACWRLLSRPDLDREQPASSTPADTTPTDA
jgi:hypothetical protein